MDHLKTPRGYAEDFDPAWYVDNYIRTLRKQMHNRGIVPFALDFLHDTFNTGRYKGDLLLDIGTGPSVHSVISANRQVTEIHLSDISPRNRDILQQWRNGEDNVVEALEYICHKENNGVTLEDRISMVREKVTQIYEVDMRLPDPLPGSNEKYDMVVASLSLCAIARGEEEYKVLLRKVIAMIKRGGYLVVIDVLNGKAYQVGNFRFTDVQIERCDLKAIYLNERLHIIEWRETGPDYVPNYKVPDCAAEEGVVGIVAQRV